MNRKVRKIAWEVFIVIATVSLVLAESIPHRNTALADGHNSFASPPEGATGGWVRRFNGSDNSYDVPSAMVVDNAGNVYVTGYSRHSTADGDYTTIKYDSYGNRQWVRYYKGPSKGSDQAHAIAVDSVGNVYVTGTSEVSISSGVGWRFDYVTIKYDTNGNRKWVRNYNGTGSSFDTPCAIAVDTDGNVYVTGTSGEGPYHFDYSTIKYDTNGNLKWARRYDGPAKDADYAHAMAVDKTGNVYVTGWSLGSTSGYDYATIKYDTNGNQKWVRRYNGPGNSFDGVSGMAVDRAGNVYVTGASDGTNSQDYATVKYDTNGNQKWVRRFNGPEDYSDDWAHAIAVDRAGNVYVTGEAIWNYKSGDDYTTIKYDTNGNQKWVRRFNGPDNDDDTAVAIAVDGAGNVHITGEVCGETGCDYATVKYDSNGNQKWERLYNGPAKDHDSASAIAVDGAGNVYVTGVSYGSTSWGDYLTIKLSP